MPFVLGYANYIKHDPYILDLRVEREREREREREKGNGLWKRKKLKQKCKQTI